jgi:hypothetical protein
VSKTTDEKRVRLGMRTSAIASGNPRRVARRGRNPVQARFRAGAPDAGLGCGE